MNLSVRDKASSRNTTTQKRPGKNARAAPRKNNARKKQLCRRDVSSRATDHMSQVVREAAKRSDAARQEKAAAHADQVATKFFNRAEAPTQRRGDPRELSDLKFKEGDLTKRTYTFTFSVEDGYQTDSQYPKYKEYVREFTIIYNTIIYKNNKKSKKKRWKLEGQINTRNDGTGSSVRQHHGRW